MKLKSSLLAVIILVVIFGGIALTSALGLYKTKTEKVPATIKSGEFAGEYDPADIRGSYSFGDIESSFDVPAKDLGKAFGVSDPDKYAEYQCKDLEATYGELADKGMEIGTGSVRYFVALYKGLPLDVEEGTYLPKSAVEILKQKATLTSEQIKNIEKFSVDLAEVKSSIPDSEPKEAENSSDTSKSSDSVEPSSDDKTIKGSTTFQDLLDWGVKKADIDKILNSSFTDANELIKDYVSNNGGEFGTLKSELQALVDNVK
jgi:hypothetical protein